VGLDRVEAFAAPPVLGSWTTHGQLGTIPEIDMETFEERRGDPSTTVLDVRRGEEFREGHVPGARNIAHTRLVEHLADLPRDRSILVYCRTGSRSAVASALLEREGFQPVYVNGMFEDWRDRFGSDADVDPGE